MPPPQQARGSGGQRGRQGAVRRRASAAPLRDDAPTFLPEEQRLPEGAVRPGSTSLLSSGRLSRSTTDTIFFSVLHRWLFKVFFFYLYLFRVLFSLTLYS